MKTPEEAWAEAREGRNLTWIAENIGVTRAAVSAWKRVPAQRMGDVGRLLGVHPSVLRPDLYPTIPADPWSALSKGT